MMIMPKLVIHAPFSKTQQQGKRSFAQTIATNIGDGYAINRRLRQQINAGDGVVLLDKETRQRAEGTLTGLQPNGWAGNGIQRYDLPLRDMTMVPYQTERLNRNGVAVIP
jgi:hypothetical protein